MQFTLVILVATLDTSKCSSVLKWHLADCEPVGLQDLETTQKYCVECNYIFLD